MTKFSKYRHHYTIPERLTSDEARERRIAAVLEREHRAQANLQSAFSLSQVAKNNRSSVAKSIVNDPVNTGHKASFDKLAAFSERDFADPAKRKQYRLLRQAQLARQKVRPTGTDKRQWNPSGHRDPYTVYGTAASISRRPRLNWLGAFKLAHQVVPCIQRSIKREVMFALGHGGRGYHTRKRRTEASDIPC